MLIGGVAGYAMCFVIPPSYRARATILPPEEDEMTTSLAMARRGLPAFGGLGRLSAYFTQADIALAVLRSRSVAEAVIGHFDLARKFGTKRRDDAIRRLGDMTDIRMAADGPISIAVEDRDPDLAAAIANHYFAELDEFNKRNRSFRAKRSRQFLEQRVAETDSSLRAAEGRLSEYQRRRGTLIIPPDARGALESAASLMAQKVQADMELTLARQYASSQSPEVLRLESRLRELERQVRAVPLNQAGGASAVREVYILQQLAALLTAQLEDARLREAMDTPTIVMLDTATAPDRPQWPRKSWVAAFGLLVGLVGAVVSLVGPGWRSRSLA